MTTPDPLQVRLHLPCAWRPQVLDAAALDDCWREARLLLILAQHGEAAGNRDGERNDHLERTLGRLEAKLDLTLHLLTSTLGIRLPVSAPVSVTLRHDGLVLPPGLATVAAEPGCCLLGIPQDQDRPLPQPLALPAQVTRLDDQGAEIRWLAMPVDLEELWSQWLFRQHRRAIHAQRDGR